MNIWDVMRWVRESRKLDPSAKLLMLEILDRAGNGQGVCWASNATLGAGIGIGERHVYNGIKALEKAGMIYVVRKTPLSQFGRRTIYITQAWTPYAPGTTVLGAEEVHPEPQFQQPGTTVPVHPEPQCLQTSPTTTNEPSDGRKDLSSRTGGGGGVDREAVLRVVAQCCYLPADAAERLEARRDVGTKLGEDWEALALAVVRTEDRRRSGEVGKIAKTVGFLLTVAKSVRGKEPPTEKERAKLQAMLDGTYKPPLRPGPVFYKAAPDEIIPLPSERRPNAEAYRVHQAPADSPFARPRGSTPLVFTPAPEDLTKVYHPAKLAKWANQKALPPDEPGAADAS